MKEVMLTVTLRAKIRTDGSVDDFLGALTVNTELDIDGAEIQSSEIVGFEPLPRTKVGQPYECVWVKIKMLVLHDRTCKIDEVVECLDYDFEVDPSNPGRIYDLETLEHQTEAVR